MTRTMRSILVLALAPCLLAATAAMAGGDANFLYGQKSLSEDQLGTAGVDGQSQFGAMVSLDFDWPVMLALDLLFSSDDNTVVIPASYDLAYSTDVATMELDVGVRKFWDKKNLRPYLGGGVAWVQLDATQVEFGDFGEGAFRDTVLNDNDSGIGFWLDAGFLYRVGRNFNVGLDVRYSDASVELTPVGDIGTLDLDSGGTHYGIVMGYHW